MIIFVHFYFPFSVHCYIIIYNRNQMTIDDLIGNSLTREEMIEEGYRLANKEIGYRIEHLNNIAHHMEAKK